MNTMLHTKLSDYGFSNRTDQLRIVDSYKYLDPEIVLGDSEIIQISPKMKYIDIYSYGCILWNLCSNQPPHAGTNVLNIVCWQDYNIPSK
jgi:serine/threonine protein kinase